MHGGNLKLIQACIRQASKDGIIFGKFLTSKPQ
jgi:hypothetical protein